MTTDNSSRALSEIARDIVMSSFRDAVERWRRSRQEHQNDLIWDPNSDDDIASLRHAVDRWRPWRQEQNIGTSLERSPEEEAAFFREVVERNLPRQGQNSSPSLQEMAAARLRDAAERRGSLRQEQNTGPSVEPSPEVATASQPVGASDGRQNSDQVLEQARRRLRQLENELRNPAPSPEPNLEVATASQSVEASDARQIVDRYLEQVRRRPGQQRYPISNPEPSSEVTTAVQLEEASDARQTADRYLERARRRLRQPQNTEPSPEPSSEVATAALFPAAPGVRRTPRESLERTNRETLRQLLERSRRRLSQQRNPRPSLEARLEARTAASQAVEAPDDRPRLSESSEPPQLLEPLQRRSFHSRNLEAEAARLWAEAVMLESDIRESRRQTRSRPTYTGPWGFTVGSMVLHQILVEETIQERRNQPTNANRSHPYSSDERGFQNAYRPLPTGGQLPEEGGRYHDTRPTLAHISEHIMRVFNDLRTDDRPAMVAWILTMAAEQVRTELAREDEVARGQTN